MPHTRPNASPTPATPTETDATQVDRRAILARMRGDTLTRIEKAVLDLFSDKDFHEVSLLDVAKKANVSLQTIYKYFGSKEVLVYAMLDVMLGRLAERMIDHLQGIDDARERLRKTCWVTLDYMDKHPAVMLLLFTAVPVSRHKNISIYESPELMGAFLGVFKDGQVSVLVADVLDEQHEQDVVLVLAGIHAAAQFIAAGPEG